MRKRTNRKREETPQPTVEEVRQQFADAGMPVDEWKERPEEKLGIPQALKRTHEGFLKIKQYLEQQIAADQEALAAACEELERLEHGGASAGGK